MTNDRVVVKVTGKINVPALIGSLKIGREVRMVVQRGEPLVCGDAALVPVLFSDGTYGILRYAKNEYKAFLSEFLSDNEEINNLLRNSTNMPVVQNGDPDEWILVLYDQNGKEVLAKLYYNAKKLEYSLKDEIVR